MTNFFSFTGKTITVKQASKHLNLEGFLVYEYNPLKVYRKNNEGLKGVLSDLTTVPTDSNKGLNFDLEHPVDILPQVSYDKSVNLILNDGKNPPRLINSRFSISSANTYKIVDRDGDNDTNIYDEDLFDQDASLFKTVNKIPKLQFNGLTTDGSFLVGNYNFYFKLCDADGNETDFVAESSVVSCHIGDVNDPFSIRGGIENENSFKSVHFTLTNIDSSYSYVVVYFTRYTSDHTGMPIPNSYKVLKKYSVHGDSAHITLSGFEMTQDVSEDEINMQYSLVGSAKSLTTCENMLFLGNVQKAEIPYKELQDLSLRFLPRIYDEETIGYVDHTYVDKSSSINKYEYYNALNIYYRLGYWNDELYRFGVVYIMKDGSLSPVFSVRGNTDLTDEKYAYGQTKVYTNDLKTERYYIPIDKTNHVLENIKENSKGVIKFNYKSSLYDSSKGNVPIGIKFEVGLDVITELKKYTKGFFIVRLKRLKLTLCQALTIGLDKSGRFPILPISSNTYLAESFIDSTDRFLTHDFGKRMRSTSDSQVNRGHAALCPEFELNQPYFNQFFTSSDFIAKLSRVQPSYEYFLRSENMCYIDEYSINNDPQSFDYNIVSVSDDVHIVKGKGLAYSSRCGDAADVSKFVYSGAVNKVNKATNIIRGIFGPYLGMESNRSVSCELLDIKIPDYDESSMPHYVDIRAKDSSPFQAISERYSWDDMETTDTTDLLTTPGMYRGDCYICNYSHRMVRNFLDPSVPINDEIIDYKSWKKHYNAAKPEETAKINRGDVNAVKIGHWATFKVMSNINLSFRCQDTANYAEMGLTGRARGFYPLNQPDTSGESKIPESFLHNAGYDTTVGNKNYAQLPDAPAYKNIYSGRILYSDISANDAFINSFRVFRALNYYDYPLTYGKIVKLVEYSGYIICIFEHGIGQITVNEKAVAANVNDGEVFIKNSSVIDKPYILSDCYGTQWPDSVIKTPSGIYGVDTVAKKIWRIALEGSLRPSLRVKTISDLKVQRFLNENISLQEFEDLPIIGIRDVKTHYNAFKKDVMFTFYDNINTLEEKVWNLCFNESLDTFVTFYSWVPSFSENINNIFFSFDRNTSKNIAKLYCDLSDIHLTHESKLFPNVLESKLYDTLDDTLYIGTLVLNNIESYYLNVDVNGDGTTGLCTIEFSLGKDSYTNNFTINNNKLFVVKSFYNSILHNNDGTLSLESRIFKVPVVASIKIQDKTGTNSYSETKFSIENIITIATDTFIDSSENLTHFWKHGLSGLFKTIKPVRPTHWYGKLHPFEIEVVVSEIPQMHKIFTNLELIANKALPESFHFEITGEVYTFADDKENMFYRQEAVKNFYLYHGYDISYDPEYININPKQRYTPYSTVIDKSAAFPLYISRIDTINEIEDYYQKKEGVGVDYQRLSGSEIIYDKVNGEYRIATHVKGCPFGGYYKLLISEEDYLYLIRQGYSNVAEDTSTNPPKYYEICQYNRRNGNMLYREDKWDVLIPSIQVMYKNEDDWGDTPPLNVVNTPLPEDAEALVLNTSDVKIFPNNLPKYTLDKIDNSDWSECSKETRIRDRYVKVRIRYTGDDLAVLYAIKTIFTISYV